MDGNGQNGSDLSKRRWTPPLRAVIALILLVLLAAIVAVLWVSFHKPKKAAVPAYNPFLNQIATLESKGVPSSPLQRAFYYSQIAQNYQAVEQWSPTLANYLKAQQVIDENNLQSQFVFYQPIADSYAALGNKKQEKAYLQKQL